MRTRQNCRCVGRHLRTFCAYAFAISFRITHCRPCAGRIIDSIVCNPLFKAINRYADMPHPLYTRKFPVIDHTGYGFTADRQSFSGFIGRIDQFFSLLTFVFSCYVHTRKVIFTVRCMNVISILRKRIKRGSAPLFLRSRRLCIAVHEPLTIYP